MLKILTILAEFFQWRRIMAEIQARRLLLDELNKVDDEADALEDEISRARIAGMHQHADRLLLRQTNLILYRSGLYSAKAGAELRGGSGYGSSAGERDPGEGSANSGPAKSAP